MGSILLVETDPETTERWANALDTAGHAVFTADGLHDAPTLLREGGIDVVVIDCYDQCVGVIELARNIELLPDAPPIVLISNSPVAPEVSVRIGAAAFLPKPCEPAELVAVIARLLGKLRPVRAFEDEPTGRTQLG
ncbi:MAG: response regulator [Myxococcota bacterium]|nr:response regulator [Deltaproteobacteria bacterium]MDQ3339280.1 response regulator [Myxococcota bacterium]